MKREFCQYLHTARETSEFGQLPIEEELEHCVPFLLFHCTKAAVEPGPHPV